MTRHAHKKRGSDKEVDMLYFEEQRNIELSFSEKHKYFIIRYARTGEIYPLRRGSINSYNRKIILTTAEWNEWVENFQRFLKGEF